MAGTLFAQDPFSAAIGHYELQFENEWVRVSRAFYKPGESAPLHDHPLGPTVYVYTVDGGPMLFKHGDFALLRKPVKAGQVRFNRGNLERHEVEYQGDIATEYLRVELRTETLELPKQDWRIAAGDDQPKENAQLRIRRVNCQPLATCGTANQPAVVVTIPGGGARFVMPETEVANPDAAPVQQIWIELKSPPAKL